MIQQLISVGFGNSSGKMSTKILQEKYQKVERFGIRVQINLPKLKTKTNAQIDFSDFTTMLSHRRNEPLLRSFLKYEDEDQTVDLQQVQNFAKKQIDNLSQELNTIDLVKDQLKVQKFMNETKENDNVARQYLTQFNNDYSKALQGYRQRKEIIKKFAEKNKMPQYQAISILRDNGYNAALFD